MKRASLLTQEQLDIIHHGRPRPVIDRLFLDNLGKRMNVMDIPLNGAYHQLAQAVIDEIWSIRDESQ